MVFHPNHAQKSTNLERPQLDIVLHGLVIEVATDESLGVEDGVLGVDGELILGSITDQSFSRFTGEGDIGRGDTVTYKNNRISSSINFVYRM